MLVLILVALVAPGGAAAAERDRERCASRGRTVDANANVRVYSRFGGLASYACSLRTGRAMFLGALTGSSSGTTDVYAIAVAGHLVGWHFRRCSFPPDGGRPEGRYCWQRNVVRIVDVRTGQRRAHFDLPGDEVVRELVLKRNGAAAWIEEWERRDSRKLRRLDWRGPAVLASGTYHDGPRNLAVSGFTLYWTERGEPRSGDLG
jgi:hypothetical protein